MTRSRFFRAGEWTFTWRRAPEGGARLDMWREDPSGRLHWVANASCRGAERARVHATALAMIAWVRSLDVAPRACAQASAVAERLACAADRMTRARAANHDVAVRLAVTRLLCGEAAAAGHGMSAEPPSGRVHLCDRGGSGAKAPSTRWETRRSAVGAATRSVFCESASA